MPEALILEFTGVGRLWPTTSRAPDLSRLASLPG